MRLISSFVPRPSPSFLLLAVKLTVTTSDGKLVEGLGTRLTIRGGNERGLNAWQRQIKAGKVEKVEGKR